MYIDRIKLNMFVKQIYYRFVRSKNYGRFQEFCALQEI